MVPAALRAAALAMLVLLLVGAEAATQAPWVEQERASALTKLHAALFTGDPRPTGSLAAELARARISAALAQAGCPPRPAARWSCAGSVCAETVNLWCRIGPAPDGTPAVVGMAHTDSVPAGPGAADDGSGVVAWIDTLQRLHRDGTHLDRPLIVALTDGEELGLLGARALLDDPPFPEPIGRIVNLEARGTTGASPLFETVGAPAPWGRWFAKFARFPTANAVYPMVYERMPSDTDLTAASEAGLSGVNHAFLGGLPRYHTPLDDRAHLDPRSLAAQAELAHGWVLALQRPRDGPPVIFADLFGWTLLWWPVWLTRPAMAAVALGWAGWLVADVRRGLTSRAAVAGAVCAVFCAIAAAVGLAEGLGLAVTAASGPVWWASPWPLRLACVGAVCASIGSLGWAPSPIGAPVARWHGVIGPSVAVGVALVAVDPRLGGLVLPACAAAVTWRTALARWGTLGLFGSAFLAVAALPFARGLDEALTLAHPALAALPLAIGVAGFAPMAPRSGRLLGSALGLAALGAAWAALSPPFTADAPQPTSVELTARPDGGAMVRSSAYVGVTRTGGASDTERLPSGTLDSASLQPRVQLRWLGPQVLEVDPGGPGVGVQVDADVRARVGVNGVSGRVTSVVYLGAGGPFTLRFDGVPTHVDVFEVRGGLPAGVDRGVAFAGPAVPAHFGDRWRLALPAPERPRAGH